MMLEMFINVKLVPIIFYVYATFVFLNVKYCIGDRRGRVRVFKVNAADSLKCNGG